MPLIIIISLIAFVFFPDFSSSIKLLLNIPVRLLLSWRELNLISHANSVLVEFISHTVAFQPKIKL